jgi:cation diffusion facilitator family transporter
VNEPESETVMEPLSELKKVVDITFYTLIPLFALSLVCGILSNSITIFTIAIIYGTSFIVQLFAFTSIRTIVKSNVMRFPYGTGKLENLSAIIYGSLCIPAALFIIYSSIMRFITPPAIISFSIAQIPLVPSLVRSALLFRKSRQMVKVTDSPLVRSYYINFKISTLLDTGVLTSLTIALALVALGHGTIGYFIDPVVSSIIAAYMLFCGVTLTIANCKVLIDLPLPEDDQLRILGILAQEYDSYENIGNIYTRFSGKTRFIELELYLKQNARLEEIMAMRQRIENRLRQYYPDVRFTLIPLGEKT